MGKCGSRGIFRFGNEEYDKRQRSVLLFFFFFRGGCRGLFRFHFQLFRSFGIFDTADAGNQSDEASEEEKGRNAPVDEFDEFPPPDKNDKKNTADHSGQSQDNCHKFSHSDVSLHGFANFQLRIIKKKKRLINTFPRLQVRISTRIFCHPDIERALSETNFFLSGIKKEIFPDPETLLEALVDEQEPFKYNSAKNSEQGGSRWPV